MDIVENLMQTRRWAKTCLRHNIVRPEEVEMWKKTKIAHVQSNSPNKRSKHDQALKSAIEAIAPEWWGEETRICLNKDVQCQRHKDGNKGHSYIVWLGDFTGGALLFDDGTRITDKYKWHLINGQIHHWNEPHEGTKFSIIIYQGVRRRKSDIIQVKRRAPPSG